MEVYKITCKINNKVYIGSTQYTKEKRWKQGHLNMANRQKQVNDNLLYVDIKKYGKDNFELETLEIVLDDKKELINRENFWIKKYWNDLGKEMLYNKWDLAYGNRNWSVPHNPEFQKKAARIRKEKYGNTNAMMMTPDAMKKAKETKIKKYGTAGPVVSKEWRKIHDIKVSNKFLDKIKGDIVIGHKGILKRLNEENYIITYWQVKRIMEKKYCKKILFKYPELEKRFVLWND